MKTKIALLFISLFSFSCKKEGELDWLLGQWKRKEHAYFENWQKINANEYKGFSYSISEGDTVNKEFLTLSKKENQWTLAVKFEDENAPTYFEVIKLDSNSFTCKNENNEFPTHIKYFAEKDELKAIIWNKDLDMKFDFEKRK